MGLFIALRYLSDVSEFAFRGEPTTEEEYVTAMTWHGPGEMPSWDEVSSIWEAAHAAWAFKNLRIERDALLLASDWTQMPDAPVDKTAWAEYRQALRDLPENTIDPENPIWPTPPA